MTTSPGTATTINTYKFSIGDGTESTYKYDKTGNVTEYTSPDAGTVKTEYTPQGQIKRRTVATGRVTEYGYDAVGNITRIKGISESSYYQNYQYDDMSRLTNASGISMEHNSDGGDVFSSYSMGMEYNIMSSPLLYDLTITTTSGTKSIENTYLYGDIQPGAPIKVGDTDYKYDASGNPVSMRGGDSDRTLRYDAENRLRVIEDTQNSTMSLYTYNHTGERSLKRYGAFNTAYLNGAYAGSGLDGLTRYSAYVSPYYVEHGTGTNSSTATKHYYIGTERLVSKLVTSVNKKDDVKEEENTYYYFTDHLGSTTHITDKGGKVVQYAAYTPYGTLFREYKSVMPYKFNGKELDQETGYYYYGARYYDPSAALWLGVDPLQHKYPDIGAYVYCAGNPVKYVDPDGEEIKSMLPKKESSGVKYYSKHDNSESLILFAHGYKDAKGIADMRHVETRSIETASDLKNVMSEVFSNYKEDEPQTIILISCHTAEDVNGIAQDLSNEMPNSTVIAPTSSIEQETSKGTIFEGRVTVQNGGDWIILKNGKETNRYNGHWQPKSHPTKMDYLLYNKKDSFIDRLIKCIKDE